MNISRAVQLCITGPDRKPCYGGDQGWFSSNTMAAGGCGSVAGANALRALCRQNVQIRHKIMTNAQVPAPIKEALCSENPGHESFSLLMTGVYETMGSKEVFPLNHIYDRMERSSKAFTRIKSTFGLTNVGFIIGIIRFARKFGIDIKVESLPASFLSKEKAREFILKGLKESGAVVMLTCHNRHNARMFAPAANLSERLTQGHDSSIRSHFTTITDIDLDRVLITTWGKPGIIDFNELAGSWRSVKAYEASLLYLVPCTRKESTSCMLGAWKLFAAGLGHSLIRR